MQAEYGKRGSECSQLLDLMSIEDWLKRDLGGKKMGDSEEKKLELTLAPPGGEEWIVVEEEVKKPTFCFSNIPKTDVAGFEANGKIKVHASSENGARAISAPVVGWPPIRSSRKNIAMTSTKQSNELKSGAHENVSKGETSKKGLFIKINMDGIPIGRKVDLNAYDNYQKLSSIVEELFSDLLAAQRDPTESGNGVSENDRMAFTGLLDGSGEYTLVYEDNEGDRMMVGDVPWDMFVSTAKRLRVLRNSELSSLFLGAVNGKRAANC